LVTGDLIRVAEDTLFAREIRLVEMSDGNPAYQLERLGAAGDLIRKTVEARFQGRRHGLVFDWRHELDESLDLLPNDPLELDQEERARMEKAAALDEVANARLSVLIGSAGTGKTTLLSVLCRHPEINKNGIVLLAPTGKARVRMEEVINRDGLHNVRAFTLAQFLLRSGRFQGRTQRYILTGQPGEQVGRTVIVDECSMLTEEILAALIESLTGIHRLILVGDHRQLPPIGPVRPFVDIISRLRPETFTANFPRLDPHMPN
jgi:predicted ABC-type transport system involved in lysophospholipase L1 biosynthesis ATPase subunit